MSQEEIEQALENRFTIEKHGIEALREKIKQELDDKLFKQIKGIDDPEIKAQKLKEYEQLEKQAQDAGIDFEGIKAEVQANDLESNDVERQHIVEIQSNKTQEKEELIPEETVDDLEDSFSAFTSFAGSTDDTPVEKGTLSNSFKPAAEGQVAVFGLLKRGGKVFTAIIPNAKTETLLPIIEANVQPDSVVYTDTFKS